MRHVQRDGIRALRVVRERSRALSPGIRTRRRDPAARAGRGATGIGPLRNRRPFPLRRPSRPLRSRPRPATAAETPLARAHAGHSDAPAPNGAPVKARRPTASHLRPPAPDLTLALAPPLAGTEPRIRAAAPSSLHPRPNPGRKPPSYAHLSQEELMDRARHYLCWQCYTPVPSGQQDLLRPVRTEVPPGDPGGADHVLQRDAEPREGAHRRHPRRGHRGARVSPQAGAAPRGSARRDRVPGRPVHLAEARELLLPRGPPVRARRGLAQRRVPARARHRGISPGDTFLAGEQLFRLDQTPRAGDQTDAEGTQFYSSPKYASPFRVTQILQGGARSA